MRNEKLEMGNEESNGRGRKEKQKKTPRVNLWEHYSRIKNYLTIAIYLQNAIF